MNDEKRTIDEGGPLDGRVRAHSLRSNEMPTMHELFDGSDAQDLPQLLPLEKHDHPEPRSIHWTGTELSAIRDYATRCVMADRAAQRESDRPLKMALEALTSAREHAETAALNHSLRLAEAAESMRLECKRRVVAAAEGYARKFGSPQTPRAPEWDAIHLALIGVAAAL